jgi:hypothetical protein
MKIKSLILPGIALFILATALFLGGCKKDTTILPDKPCKNDTIIIRDTIKVAPPTCNIKGAYTYSATSSTGNSAVSKFTFLDNNLTVGTSSLAGPDVTYGGYRNTCDSVILSVYYTTPGHYYIIAGKLSNNNTTITGTFKNLTNTADFGTITLQKQ